MTPELKRMNVAHQNNGWGWHSLGGILSVEFIAHMARKHQQAPVLLIGHVFAAKST